MSQEQFCQQKQISIATLHRWRKKYGLMDEADARRLKVLEKENTELKKMYAEAGPRGRRADHSRGALFAVRGFGSFSKAWRRGVCAQLSSGERSLEESRGQCSPRWSRGACELVIF